MAPSAALLPDTAAAVAGELPGDTPTVPGMFPYMLPLPGGQFGALPMMSMQGAPVRVRRPTDYYPWHAATLGPTQPNPSLNLAAVGLTLGSEGGLEGPDRIFVGGLPCYSTESQIRELLESFGPLREFDLVKDRETGYSKGYAFCVFQDSSATDIACAALNGIKIGDETLTVRRANQAAPQPKSEHETVVLQAQVQIALQRLRLEPNIALSD